MKTIREQLLEQFQEGVRQMYIKIEEVRFDHKLTKRQRDHRIGELRLRLREMQELVKNYGGRSYD